MLKTDQRTLTDNVPAGVRSLYDRHANMLLGYIFEVVKDRKLAEEYMVKIFCDISLHFNTINWNGTSSWCQLQRFAKGKLSGFNATVKLGDTQGSAMSVNRKHKYFSLLTDLQERIFCDVYYHGKTIEVIANELNQTEDLIRRSLKEAFAIMRKNSEN
jgi:hypothetical protein